MRTDMTISKNLTISYIELFLAIYTS